MATRRQAFERFEGFAAAVAAAVSVADLTAVVQRQLRRQGFPCFTYMFYPSRTAVENWYFSNHPATWVDRYTEQHYSRYDFVVHHAAVAVTPFVWGKIAAPRFRTPVQRQIVAEAKECGVASGGAVPIHGPAATRALLAVTDEVSEEEFARKFAHERFELHLVASYVHEKVLDMRPQIEQARPAARLSAREVEVLTWSAGGKTVADISSILSISDATCAEYLKNACRKLGAGNKTHAVAIALKQGLIAL
jgi:DNA-binding CsgD family transcriptional regulator